ncbi:hypothetical protein M3647_21225 [Paenibacillus cellulositrophicus]|uniref:hypothetical protein n=1 Tax=Paenibacillus cellulositrophicus TaxID=562959 RepID=UPI00203ACEC2|nr:hypothetical protein [Paenibacillus cellulositrophicus]MCM3000000.1 hypothetical protein [Paenibacillus cellulositrophicus]
MEKLIVYKDKFFFLQSVNFDKFDMEFNILDLGGKRIGSTIFGIKEEVNPFNSEEEKEEFMEWVQDESHKIEAEFKFLFEFFQPVEAANKLSLSTAEIKNIMDAKWRIPSEVMDAILP